MYTSDLSPVAEVRGTFALDRKPKRVDCSNKFPELTCAHYFNEWLGNHGITCSKEAADTRLHEVAVPDSLTVIGQTSSPTLRRIAFETNHASNNLYAETLLKTLGKELRNEGCYDSSYIAVKNVLKDLGADVSRGIRIQDGSGLSRQNLVSPDFFCRYLEAMIRTANVIEIEDTADTVALFDKVTVHNEKNGQEKVIQILLEQRYRNH